jgi:hypothetical protein
MFRRLLALVMTAGLVFGGAAPVSAAEAGAAVGSVSKDGKGKTGKKKGKKKGKKGKKKGNTGAKKGSPKKGAAKKGKKG